MLSIVGLLAGVWLEAGVQPLVGIGEVVNQPLSSRGGTDAGGQRVAGQHQFDEVPRLLDAVQVVRRIAQVGPTSRKASSALRAASYCRVLARARAKARA
jgi:hypothetical protein